MALSVHRVLLLWGNIGEVGSLYLRTIFSRYHDDSIQWGLH